MDLAKIAQTLQSPPPPMRLRQGTVVSVQADYTLTVTIGGSAVEVPGVKYLGSYTPRPADQVWLLVDGFDLIALGHLAPRATPKPRASRSTTQSIPNDTDTIIDFDAVEDDGWGCWSVGQAARLTAPLPGRYMAVGQVSFAANSTGYRHIYLEADGTTVVAAHREGGQPSAVGTSLQVVMPPRTLAAGGYIRLGVRQTSTVALDVLAGADLGLIYLGAAE